MAQIREILVSWTAGNTQGGTSVLFFDLLTDVEAQRADLGAALATTSDLLATGVFYEVATEGRIIDDTTGELTGTWSDATEFSGNGTTSGGVVSNASQVLVRFLTSTIRDGRVIKGRVNIPGLAASLAPAGEPSAAVVTSLTTAWGNLTGAGGLVVWSRPRAANPDVVPPVEARTGISVPTTGISVWSELAVLRRRR